MSNSSFVYIHIYMYIYVHVSMYQMAPVVVTWRDLAKHCPWSKGQLIGNGIYCAPWHSASSYPIPPEGEWILFLCGFIFAIIIIIIIIFDVVVVVVVVKIPSFFKISQ